MKGATLSYRSCKMLGRRNQCVPIWTKGRDDTCHQDTAARNKRGPFLIIHAHTSRFVQWNNSAETPALHFIPRFPNLCSEKWHGNTYFMRKMSHKLFPCGLLSPLISELDSHSFVCWLGPGPPGFILLQLPISMKQYIFKLLDLPTHTV